MFFLAAILGCACNVTRLPFDMARSFLTLFKATFNDTSRHSFVKLIITNKLISDLRIEYRKMIGVICTSAK